MAQISLDQLPDDYWYYRTISPDYLAYLQKCSPRAHHIPAGQYGHFAWAKKILGLWIVKAEKMDEELSLDMLRNAGISGSGVILWIPWKLQQKPSGWCNFWLPPTHNTNSGYADIGAVSDYRQLWKTRARRGLTRAKKAINAGELIIRPASDDEFVAGYEKTPISYWGKSVFTEYFLTMRRNAPTRTHAWVAVLDGEVVAGLATLDYGPDHLDRPNASVHLVAFTQEAAKPSQAGTALIDAWFDHCKGSGIRYINFDHLRDSKLAKDQQGYTDFKENFIQYHYRHVITWFRFFKI